MGNRELLVNKFSWPEPERDPGDTLCPKCVALNDEILTLEDVYEGSNVIQIDPKAVPISMGDLNSAPLVLEVCDPPGAEQAVIFTGHPNPGAFIFKQKRKEILRFEPEGDVYVRGEKVDNNQVIYRAVKAFFKNTVGLVEDDAPETETPKT
jgi:hypothetical protein